jgi:tetratricopeptide (TPR) repeat protein
MHPGRKGLELLSRAIAAAVASALSFVTGPLASIADPTPAPAAASPAHAPDFAEDIASAKELARKGHSRDAIALLESDHKLDPSNRDVTVALAQTLSYAGERGQAITLLDDLLKAAPDDVDARVILAQAYAFNHDYASAEYQYRAILKTAPDDEDAQVGLAQTYAFEGRFIEAKTLFAQILAKDPKNFDALVGLAGAEGFAGEYRQARSDYRAVLVAQPDNTDALTGLATVEYWLGNIPAAISLDNRALANNPEDSDARDLKKQLTIKTAPQLISSLTTSHSTDGSTYDYQVAGRYYLAPSTSVGLLDELYQIGNSTITVQTHRFGFLATYKGSSQFGADLRIVGSKFGGVPQVTDSVLSLFGAHDALSYGVGVSQGGVEGSVLANGGQSAPGQQSAIVRINTLFANAAYTRRGSTLGVTAQDAYYNDGNRFHEFTLGVSHQFGIGASETITPAINFRQAGFSDSYTNQAIAASPGYYDYNYQRDFSVAATVERQVTDRFSLGMIGRLGWRHTEVPVYPQSGGLPIAIYGSGTLPFQNFEPYFDYEGDRFSLTGAIYDDHYTGSGAVLPFAATTVDINVTIRLP